MTDIVDMLERLGGDAQLRYADRKERLDALTSAGIDGAAASALLAGESRALERQLDARSDSCCLVWAPQRDDEEEEDEETPAQEDAPGKDGPKSQHRVVA